MGFFFLLYNNNHFYMAANHLIRAMASKSALFLSFAILLSFSTIAPSDADPDCVYTVYIRTGSIFNGGTDSIISLALYTKQGDGILIRNLEKWGGLMGKGHDYFERGNLDIFSGRGPCLSKPVCSMNLTSDGSGEHHGWYCNYVEVTTTGVHGTCSQAQFEVEQWLALDTDPYELFAFRNGCSNSKGSRRDLIKSHPLPKSTYVL